MSENSLEYAQMIEIPVSTCTVTYKKSKKKKKRREDLQNRLLDKVNKKVNEENIEMNENSQETITDALVIEKPVKKVKNNDFENEKGKLNIVMLEFIIVCVLCAAIFLTNIFIPDSGINTFLRNTFMSSEKVVEDTRDYSVFDASTPVKSDNVTVDEGVMTLTGSASIYAPCDGTITSLVKGEDDLYIIEIAHNSVFKTIISGASFAYYNVGDSVYSSIPVAYLKEGSAKVYLYNDGSLLSNYKLENGSIIWQV
jgi:hypothetical protein